MKEWSGCIFYLLIQSALPRDLILCFKQVVIICCLCYIIVLKFAIPWHMTDSPILQRTFSPNRPAADSIYMPCVHSLLSWRYFHSQWLYVHFSFPLEVPGQHEQAFIVYVLQSIPAHFASNHCDSPLQSLIWRSANSQLSKMLPWPFVCSALFFSCPYSAWGCGHFSIDSSMLTQLKNGGFVASGLCGAAHAPMLNLLP